MVQKLTLLVVFKQFDQKTIILVVYQQFCPQNWYFFQFFSQNSLWLNKVSGTDNENGIGYDKTVLLSQEISGHPPKLLFLPWDPH